MFLPMMTYYINMGYDIKDFPISYNNYSKEISLPVYYDLTDENIKTVIDAIVKSVEKHI